MIWILLHQQRDEINDKDMDLISFSILLPFRNEKDQIEKCILSIINQNYSKAHFELIPINDWSTDNSPSIAEDLSGYFINASGKGKKRALETGINHAQHPWIITVDADCVFPRNWLSTLNSFINSTKSDVVIAPVEIELNDSFISRFQVLDFAATMALTRAGIQSKWFYLCNGANFIYKKSLFEKVKGYNGNYHVKSGDDVFLLKKFKSLEGISINHIGHKDAMCRTSYVKTVGGFLKQRKRWATKTKAYANSTLFIIQGILFTNALFFLLTIIVGICNITYTLGQYFLLLAIVRIIIDLFFLKKTTALYASQSVKASRFITLNIAYSAYIIYMGFLAIFPSKTTWKGRTS